MLSVGPWLVSSLTHPLPSFVRYFLQAGYAVIFLHRSKSLEPFNRHWSQRSLLSLLETRTNPEGCVGAGKTTICGRRASVSPIGY